MLNKLHNAIIIEDKANLAFLQILMNCPTLPTFVCRNIAEITSFYKKHLELKDGAYAHGSVSNGLVVAAEDW